MKRDRIISGLLGSCLLLWLTACSNEEAEPMAAGEVAFHIETKATGDTPRLTRLYLAERLSEHANKPGVFVEGLHCELAHRYFIDGSYWQTGGLFGQWYKFAFVNVPNIVNMPDGAKKIDGKLMFPDPNKKNPTDPAYMYECDFNKLYVDFSQVIDFQEAYVEEALGEEGSQLLDLAIYRKNIDRWVNANNPTSEDVTLTRITGELVLDMGIPADQFEHPVSGVTVTVPQLAQAFYIRDGSADSVWVIRGEKSYQFYWEVDPDETTQNSRQLFRLTLLPDKLENATVTVAFHEEGITPMSFPLQSDDEEPVGVQIKKNKRTRVLFNGLHQKEFEVRYAGFDDNASIDVEDDNWDGPAYEEENKKEEVNKGEGEGNGETI